MGEDFAGEDLDQMAEDAAQEVAGAGSGDDLGGSTPDDL
jgi:hypothetical protein